MFTILEKLVKWDNSLDNSVIAEAIAEAKKWTGDKLFCFLDPFAGGGAIPFEATRLGLTTYAHDLNPVAVMINKAMIEVPYRFRECKPVNPESRMLIAYNDRKWNRATGLADDVLYYGKKLLKLTEKRIGHLFPDAKLDTFTGKVTPIAWIWARTVKCNNPMCGRQIPLVKSFTLSKTKGKEVNAKPFYDESGHLHFDIKYSTQKTSPTIRNTGAICPSCGQPIPFSYIREEAKGRRLGQILLSTVVDTKKGRFYLAPDKEQIEAANISEPDDIPQTEMPDNALGFRVQAYGIKKHSQLFTNRQLLVLNTLIDELMIVALEVEQDALQAGMSNSHLSFETGGDGAKAYSDAVSLYLAMVIDRIADYNSALCAWQPGGNKAANTFNRPALSMSWDFAEANPFSEAYGSFINKLEWAVEAIQMLHTNSIGYAEQADAQVDCGLRNIIVSTDPPYYDNIGYADLSDFFYIWLRKSLKDIFPKAFSTMLVPKEEELIATPFRNEGNQEKAKQFFENGMLATCRQLYKYVTEEIPLTIYYAFKQSDTYVDDQDTKKSSSSGWETILNAIIQSGFMITGTWPMRTEMPNRTRNMESNALATSIVLVCRKRPDERNVTRRSFINELRRELRPALKQLQLSNIAPVDLAQSAIGPGMGVFSRYQKVLEADGTPMSVRNALQVINEEIDLYFNEQVGDLDAMSRFCVDLYTQNAFNDIRFGDADILARAKGTSVATLSSHSVVYAKAGIVHLIERTELSKKIDNNESCIWMLTQQLTQAMATGGVEACAKAIFMMLGSNAERAKDLAYRLYTIAEQKKWSTEAFAYNALVVAWPDIQSRAAMMKRETPEQLDLFSMGLLDPNS